jgi:hypothetical protein
LGKRCDRDRKFNVPSIVVVVGGYEPLGIPELHVVALVADSTLDIPAELKPGRVIAIQVEAEASVIEVRVEGIAFVLNGGLIATIGAFGFVGITDDF